MKRCFILFFICMLSANMAHAQGVLVLAGGGAEGDSGDTSSWSYQLYSQLVANGDADGDGTVRVAIIAESIPNNPSDANWLPDYFQWMGTTLGLTVVATNYEVASRSAANSSGTVGGVASADVVFIKGGDQGAYYDFYNDTLLETHIASVANRGGALGGTSAGAMSYAAHCFSGGKDMISDDVLTDSHSDYLDDASQPGTSGIHTDFLNYVSNVLIDTHFTQRGRMGRLAGLLAKATDDSGNNTILGIGLEQKTGVCITGNIAEVMGIGAVSFLKQSSQTQRVRTPGKPLFYTNLTLDRLTHGWQYDLSSRTALTGSAPSGTTSLNVALPNRVNSGALSISGATETDKEKFGHTGTYYPDDYSRVSGSASPYIKDGVGFTDSGNSSSRADKHETLFRLLHDAPEDLGFLVYSGSTVERNAGSADVLTFSGNSGSLVISAEHATHTGISPYISSWASSGGSLKAAAFTSLRVHILSDSETHELGIHTGTHQLVAATGGGGGPGGSGLPEIEPNDSRSSAQDLTNETLPITIDGTIDTTSDRDYFKIRLNAGATINAALAVPSGVDYDLYLLNNRGRTLERSVNDGNGVSEALSYTNTSNKAKTYYVEVESYSGADANNAYALDLNP